MKADRQVYRASLAELIDGLAKAERHGQLAGKIRFYARSSVLIVDEIGYLPSSQGGANLFDGVSIHWIDPLSASLQLVNARYEKGAFAIAPRARTDGAAMGNSRTHGDTMAHSSRRTAALPNGARSSAIRSLPPRSSTGFSTMP